MQKLYLGANQFSEVPMNIGNLSMLNLIDISENNIVKVKRHFFSLPSLTNIYLNDNKIKNFPFADIPVDQIVEMNLSGNIITDFPDILSDKIKR
jgi:Leucine-rich repeat (LRR) protein